jgi:hypothetical protein
MAELQSAASDAVQEFITTAREAKAGAEEVASLDGAPVGQREIARRMAIDLQKHIDSAASLQARA